MNKQEISLQKKMSIVVEAPKDAEDKCNRKFVLTLNANLQALGFSCSQELFDELLKCSHQQVINLYEEILPILKKMVGAHRSYKPMYPNFPQQVMEASDAELYGNAMAHYWGSFISDVIGDPKVVLLPQYDKKARPSLTEIPPLRLLNLINDFGFRAIFSDLVLANSSISASDKEILSWFIKNDSEFVTVFLGRKVEKIPQKETLAYLAGTLPDPMLVSHLLKTATDTLRVAVAMSGGDVSLATSCKFRNFKNKERRFFLQTLENCGSSLTEDMLRWQERWKRLGEKLHPGDYQSRYPKAFAAFNIVRNDTDFRTFNSQVETAISERKIAQAIKLLSQRGGVFARRLDHLLRTATSKRQAESIILAFTEVVNTVSTPVLLQVYNHFNNRQSGGPRTFFPKGNVCKLQVSDVEVPSVGEGYCLALVEIIRAALVERFKALPKLGKVYLDDKLKNYFVPFALRSASKSLRTLTRGSRIDLPAGDCIRMFLWWKNMKNDRVDIDLSALLLDDEWNVVEQIAYYNLRGQGGAFVHSGDITSAPKGACEFIDIDMPSVSDNVRYVVMTLNSYCGYPYCDLPECFAGWMMRSDQNSGEIFDARTVANKIDLAANATAAAPLVLDLKQRQMIWADLSLTGRNLFSTSKTVGAFAKGVANMNRPRLYDLFSMHVEARGRQVKSADKANLIISENGILAGDYTQITPYDLDKIMSQFMG